MIKVAEPSARRGSPHVLTNRRRRILQFIEEYAADKGRPPSDQEIADGVKLKSRSSVQYHLVWLKAAGYVTYEEGLPRTVRVLHRNGQDAAGAGGNGAAPGRARPRARRKTGPTAAEKVAWVPIVGQVAAGEPIPPLESIQERFPLPREMVGAEEGLFILTVVGDSMIGAGIRSGDMVVVRQLYERPQNGDIVAALFDGIENEGTVKTYKRVDRHIWLMSQNPAYTPILGDKATIHGKVVAVLRQL